jgi:hypothetical protein
MATPQNDAQNPLANDEVDTPVTAANGHDRREEAEDRARHGQSLAMGDTGDHQTGVKPDTQGISNRPGDAPAGTSDEGDRPPGYQ